MAAVERSRVVVADELLRAGADVHATRATGLGWSAIHYAGYASPAAISLVLEAGGKIEARTISQMTPLMLAAWSARPAPFKDLLDRGAQWNAVDASGNDVLEFLLWRAPVTPDTPLAFRPEPLPAAGGPEEQGRWNTMLPNRLSMIENLLAHAPESWRHWRAKLRGDPEGCALLVELLKLQIKVARGSLPGGVPRVQALASDCTSRRPTP